MTLTTRVTWTLAIACAATFVRAEGVAPHPVDPALALAAEGRHAEAIAAFERVKVEQPESIASIHGLKIAVVHAELGDPVAHEAHCRWLMDRYRNPETSSDADRAVKGYLLLPAARDPELLAQALKLARFATDHAEASGEADLLSWFQITRGLAEYRTGGFAEAEKWTAKATNDESPYIRSLALACHAMAAHRAGMPDAARASLAAARALVDAMPKLGTATYAKEWTDTLVAKMTLAEASLVLANGDAP